MQRTTSGADDGEPAPLRVSSSNPRSACERCRSRKNKCDSLRPQCMRCRGADATCVYAAGSVIIGNSSIISIGREVAVLDRPHKRPRSDTETVSAILEQQRSLQSVDAHDRTSQQAVDSPIRGDSLEEGRSNSVAVPERNRDWNVSGASENVNLPSHSHLLQRLPTVQDLGTLLRDLGPAVSAAPDSTASPGTTKAISLDHISRKDLPQWPGEAQMLARTSISRAQMRLSPSCMDRQYVLR